MNDPEISPILKSIEMAVADVPGWSSLEQLKDLFLLVWATNHLAGDVLEIGSWCGRSAIALAMATQSSPLSRVHCVDLWPEKSDWYKNEDGSYSFSVNVKEQRESAYVNQTVWSDPFHNDIEPVYERWSSLRAAFEFFIKKNGLEKIIVPHKGTSKSFFAQRGSDLAIRLAFIDGDHCYEAVKSDIEAVEEVLVPGGFICFDDAFSYYEGVDNAIQDCVIATDKYSQYQQIGRKLFVAQKTAS